MAWKDDYDGTIYSRETFKKHLDSIPVSELSWIKYLIVHNTGAPSIEQQKKTKGGASQRMKNAKPHYAEWQGGPHYWVFHTGEIGKGTALPAKGTHSPSYNKTAMGVEMVADFDGTDDPESPDGKVIVDTTAWLFAQVLMKIGKTASIIKLHKEDPKTTHDCPGKLFKKDAFVAKVKEYMGEKLAPKKAEAPKEAPKATKAPKPAYDVKEIQTLLKAHGFDCGPIDGDYGPKTKAAVVAFQTSLGLKGDGIVGPYTWAKLSEAPKTPEPVSQDYRSIEELHPSEYCISWMKRFEGLRLEAYDDVGSWAIGYGHNATSKRKPIPMKGMKITEEEANEILHADAEAIGDEVKKVLKGCKVTQAMFDALTLDCFQRGMTQFAKTPVVAAIKNGDEDPVVAFTRQAVHKNAGVTRRREVQVLIFKGEKPTKW
jgi:GH24 family phage-related lysozyme (muramidase)